MALTGSDLRYLRRKVGSLPVDADLQEIYDAYEADGKSPHSREWVVLDVLEGRLAELIANPASFSVAGEYSQSTSANIKALEDAIAAHRSLMAGLGIELDVSGNGIPFRVIPATSPPFAR